MTQAYTARTLQGLLRQVTGDARRSDLRPHREKKSTLANFSVAPCARPLARRETMSREYLGQWDTRVGSTHNHTHTVCTILYTVPHRVKYYVYPHAQRSRL